MILPQAFRGSIAPLGSVLIALIKNTTVAAVIGVGRGRQPDAEDHRERDGGSLTIFRSSRSGFVILTLPLGRAASPRLSRRLAVKR